MEFVNEINEKEEKKHKAKKAPTTLQIGFIKYKNGDIEFELKDVKVTDVESLREFFWEVIDELERQSK